MLIYKIIVICLTCNLYLHNQAIFPPSIHHLSLILQLLNQSCRYVHLMKLGAVHKSAWINYVSQKWCYQTFSEFILFLFWPWDNRTFLLQCHLWVFYSIILRLSFLFTSFFRRNGDIHKRYKNKYFNSWANSCVVCPRKWRCRNAY